MRVLGKSLIPVACGVLIAGWAIGQQPQFGGGFGKGQGQQDVLTILRNPAVKKALDITDEQLSKVPDAVLKALADILNKEQLARFKQIELQQRGPQAFRDPSVQTTLKMSDEQKEGVSSILMDSQNALQELFKENQGEGKGGFGGGQGMQDKMNAIRKDTAARVTSILTADQKKQWREMIGEELKLDTGFGGAGGFGKGGNFKKKTDK